SNSDVAGTLAVRRPARGAGHVSRGLPSLKVRPGGSHLGEQAGGPNGGLTHRVLVPGAQQLLKPQDVTSGASRSEILNPPVFLRLNLADRALCEFADFGTRLRRYGRVPVSAIDVP